MIFKKVYIKLINKKFSKCSISMVDMKTIADIE